MNADDSAVFPVALKSSIMPLEAEAYYYGKMTAGIVTYSSLTLRDFDEELYTFAIWGRVFATDGQEADPPVEEVAAETTPAVTESVQTTTPDAAHSHYLSGLLLIPALALALRR